MAASDMSALDAVIAAPSIARGLITDLFEVLGDDENDMNDVGQVRDEAASDSDNDEVDEELVFDEVVPLSGLSLMNF
ncbi:hypothetical protein HAX54_031673 [Datura stramonium]|uniref:Uncharacterized protein n=1 Tax=Datura stramonium TaxID=4076 RepID=A0ABS8V9G4_DATST|nr:hypothetical protein [Datura stramonium]